MQVPKPQVISKANSQVDGVAQQWQRVEGSVPPAPNLEQQQIRSMGTHWDRVDQEGQVSKHKQKGFLDKPSGKRTVTSLTLDLSF